MRRLTCTEGGSNKFWEGSSKGSSLLVCWGKLGTQGQTKAKKLASPADAEKELAKLVKEKLAKGYVESPGEAAVGPAGETSIVDQVIAKIRADGAKARHKKPRPLSDEALRKLTLPGGKPLPPSLRTWLAFDARSFDLFADFDKPVFRAVDFTEFLARQYDLPDTKQKTLAAFGLEGMGEATKKRFTGSMIELPPSANQGHLLYVGTPDARGEYPVFGWQKESMWIKYPGFDQFLAVHFELEGHDLDSPSPMVAAAIKEQQRLNLGGKAFVSAT